MTLIYNIVAAAPYPSALALLLIVLLIVVIDEASAWN